MFAIHETFGNSTSSQDLITVKKHKNTELNMVRKLYGNIIDFFLYKHDASGSHVPLAELLEDDSVGKSLSADPDPLQHTVTPQLLQDQISIQLPCLRTTFYFSIFITLGFMKVIDINAHMRIFCCLAS